MLGPLWEEMGETKSMVLTGTFERILDDKLRFSLPKGLRQQLQTGSNVLYLTPGTDGSLALYPEASFEQLATRLADRSPTRRDVRTFSRLFYSRAQRCELDRQGRVRIAPALAEMSGLSREVTLVGVRDYIEIWDSLKWRSYCDGQLDQYDAVAEQAFLLEDHNAETPPSTNSESTGFSAPLPR